MPLQYALIFTLLSAATGYLAILHLHQGSLAFSALNAYLSLGFGVMGAAFAFFGPRVFQKKPDGRRHWFAWTYLGSYIALCNMSWLLYRARSKEPAYAAITDRVILGRRLSESEAREGIAAGWVAVLDVAAELSESSSLRSLPAYRSLPLLDTTSPTLDELQSAVDWIHQQSQIGPVYVHCALGHGRSATVVLAYLMARRHVATVAEGLKMLQSKRPLVRLHPHQKMRLREFERYLGSQLRP